MPSHARILRLLLRALPLLALVVAAISRVAAEPSALQVSIRPPRAEADGTSFVTVTAIVRDSGGRLVSDGEIVSFSTTLGNIEATAVTKGGQASAQLTAPSIPGTAVVTVSAGRATSESRIVFTRPGASDWQPTRTVVITGDYVAYDDTAKAVDIFGQARIRAGGVSITGDRAQVLVQAGAVIVESRAGGNGTEVREGTKSFRADRVRYDWSSRDGYAMGITDPVRGMFYFSTVDLVPVPTRETFAVSPFDLLPTGESPLIIKGSRVVLEPGVEMVFNHAEIFLAGKRRFGLPVFVFPIGAARQGDPNYLGVGPEGFLLDLPYTFAAGAAGVAQARLKYNAPEGLYGAYVAGWALDLLSRYNAGGSMDGTLELSRITSTDRGLTWTHNQSFGSALQSYASFETRGTGDLSLRYSLANLSLSYRAKPYIATLSAFGSDVNVTTGNVRMAVQTRPKRLNDHLSWSVGTSTAWTWYPTSAIDPGDPNRTITTVEDRNTTGFSGHLSTPGLKVFNVGTVNASAGAGVSLGGGSLRRTLTGSLGYSQRFARSGQLRLTYSYSDLDQGPTQISYADPISGELRIFYIDAVEKQTTTASVSYSLGRWSAGAFATYGIDQQSWNGRVNSQYRIARNWSLYGSAGYFRQRLFVFEGTSTEPVREAFSQTSWQVRLERTLGERALSLVYDTYNDKVYLEYVPGRLL